MHESDMSRQTLDNYRGILSPSSLSRRQVSPFKSFEEERLKRSETQEIDYRL